MRSLRNGFTSIIATVVLVFALAVQTPTQSQNLVYGIAGASQSVGTPVAMKLGTDGGEYLTQKATYTAALTVKTATAAGTAPFFSICGSATKTVRVQQIVISGTVATAAVYGEVTLRKTSTATSAGTPTALVAVPAESTDAAATVGLLNFYTALATAGALVGTVGHQIDVFPITGTVAASMPYIVFDYTVRGETKAPTLRGTTQCLEAGFGTTPGNTPTLDLSVMWTEE